MAKYPVFYSGQRLTAALLSATQPDRTIKAVATSRQSTTTVTDDPELAGIALAVGTWHIRLLLLWYTDTSATPDIKTRWGFSGTWNTPLRALIGAPSSNTAAPGAITPMLMGAIATNADATYGSASGTVPYVSMEETYTATVTVAGNLSLQWAQRVSDASNSTVAAGSMFEIRQLA